MSGFRQAADMLAAAAGLIGGKRAFDYGPADENYGRVAALWNGWLAARREPAAPLNAHDALVMMALMKLARTQGGAGSRDNYIDAVGYAALAGEIAYDDSKLSPSPPGFRRSYPTNYGGTDPDE